MRYYIASRLENVDQVRKLKSELDARGWIHTYDWTVHGSVHQCAHDVIARLADAEAAGAAEADVVIVLLPGGRGTHIEAGIGIGLNKRVVIASDEVDRDFGIGGRTCAFYHHRRVEQVHGFDHLLEVLLA
jgi:hypothetical protein